MDAELDTKRVLWPRTLAPKEVEMFAALAWYGQQCAGVKDAAIGRLGFTLDRRLRMLHDVEGGDSAGTVGVLRHPAGKGTRT